jgi:hypothetical protein
MLLKRKWLSELLATVEAHHHGTPFWRAYLNALEAAIPDVRGSEAEIYFNFALMFHSGDLAIRRFRWDQVTTFRDEQLARYDYITLSHPERLSSDELSRLRAAVWGSDLPAFASPQGRFAASASANRNG